MNTKPENDPSHLQDIQGKSILIVDDNLAILGVLSGYLKNCGFTVLTEQDGNSAIEKAQSAIPALILLDIMMPGIDGFETCRRLKTIAVTQNIPVIFLTALSEVENKMRGFEVGAVDYVTKPIQFEEVFARVTTHLRIQQFQTQLKTQNNLLQQRNQELALLQQLGQMFSSSLDLNDVLNTALEGIQHLLKIYSASFWLIEQETGELVCMQAKGPGSESVLYKQLPLGQGITGRAAKKRESIVIPDIQVDKRHFKFVNDVHSMMSIPLQAKEKVIGILNLVDLRVGHFTSQDLILLEPIAAAAAIAIENARLYTTAQQEIAERKRAEAALEKANQELQRLALLDGLTQIANRRWFDEYLHLEWQRSIREGLPLALILCDVDYFKLYNDTYGHQAGDKCLQQIARAMSRAVQRPADFVARYGGEEFVIILPDTAADGARHVAQALQHAVQQLKIPHSQSSVNEYVTLSLGIVWTKPEQADSSAEFVAVADEALYEAKTQGRNRYLCSRTNRFEH